MSFKAKPNVKVTRGAGVLEGLLAKLRVARVNQLIPEESRAGAILDIGSGYNPYFLRNTRFARKVAMDAIDVKERLSDCEGIEFIQWNLESVSAIPLESESFEIITMLAVFEHLLPEQLPGILNEVYRMLKPGGRFIMTTPAGWTDFILRTFAAVGLVSAEEIHDHKDTYDHRKIRGIFQRTHFQSDKMSLGTFEMGMNLWCEAKK